MIKVRIKFKRGEELRFLSHLDQHRMFTRALRRADLPISFSHGFNPHPIISFANALSVGMTSDSEYVDIGLDLDSDEEINLKQLHKTLQSVLPKGIKISKVEILPEGAKSLTRIIEYADYDITCTDLHVTDIDSFNDQLNDFVNQEVIEIESVNKKGKKKVRNIRPAFETIEAIKQQKDVILFHIRMIPVENSLLSPEKVILTFLGQINYYGNKLNITSHRKDLVINEDL